MENDENGKEGVDVNVKAVGPFEIVATVESEILKKWFVPKINPQKFPSKTVVSESKGNKRTKKTVKCVSVGNVVPKCML